LSAELLLTLLLLRSTTVELPAPAVDISPGPDGTFYVLTHSVPRLSVIGSDGTVLSRLDLPEVRSPSGIAVRDDGWFCVSDAAAGEILVYGRRGELSGRLEADGFPGALAWSGTDVWYCSIDDPAVRVAAPGSPTVIRLDTPAVSISVLGTRAVCTGASGAVLFGSTAGITGTFDCTDCVLSTGGLLALRGDSVMLLPSDSLIATGTGTTRRLVWSRESGALLFYTGGLEALLVP
jgi:hypothetical protein